MIPVSAPLASPDPLLPIVEVRVDRPKLAKRLWRGTASDGQEFGVAAARPLRDGDTLHQTAQVRYVVRQEPEALLEISLQQLAPSAAAGIGWAVGNLHLELMAEPARLLTPDDKAARQLLDRLQMPFRETVGVFRAGRFARGETAQPAAQELGPSHKH